MNDYMRIFLLFWILKRKIYILKQLFWYGFSDRFYKASPLYIYMQLYNKMIGDDLFILNSQCQRDYLWLPTKFRFISSIILNKQCLMEEFCGCWLTEMVFSLSHCFLLEATSILNVSAKKLNSAELFESHWLRERERIPGPSKEEEMT